MQELICIEVILYVSVQRCRVFILRQIKMQERIQRYKIIKSSQIIAGIRRGLRPVPNTTAISIYLHTSREHIVKKELLMSQELLNKGIYFRRPYVPLSFINLDTTMLGVLIQDLEQLQGVPVLFSLQILHPRTLVGVHAAFYNLLYLYVKDVFYRFGKLVLDYSLVATIFYFGNATLDIDLILEFMGLLFSESYYGDTPKLFKVCADTLAYMQIYSAYHLNIVGYSFRMSGKFSRHLSTQARSMAVRAGNTSGSFADRGAVYRYAQGSNASGAYGIHLCYYTKNLIRLYAN